MVAKRDECRRVRSTALDVAKTLIDDFGTKASDQMGRSRLQLWGRELASRTALGPPAHRYSGPAFSASTGEVRAIIEGD